MPDVGQVRQQTAPQPPAPGAGQARQTPAPAPAPPRDLLQLTDIGEKAGRVWTLKTNADQSVRQQSWESKGNGAIYTRLDDANRGEVRHEIIIPRGLAPDQWVIEGTKQGAGAVEWRAYPASRPQEVRVVPFDPSSSRLQIPIGSPQNPSFLMYDTSNGDVAMGSPRQAQPDRAHGQAIPQQFQYLRQTVHADGSETLHTHELLQDYRSWGMQCREVRYIQIHHDQNGITAEQVTMKKKGFFPEKIKHQQLEVAMRQDGSYDVKGSDFSAHVPQGEKMSKNDRPALHIDTYFSNPQRLAMISAVAGSVVAAGMAAAQSGPQRPPVAATPPQPPPAARPTAAPSVQTMGEAPPPPSAFTPASASRPANGMPTMPPPPLRPNRASGALPSAAAANQWLAQHGQLEMQLMSVLQQATNPDDPQVQSAHTQMLQLQAMRAIAGGATPQSAAATIAPNNSKLEASNATIMQADPQGEKLNDPTGQKLQSDPQLAGMVQQHMMLIQQNMDLTSLIIYAARQGALHVDPSQPDPAMARLPNPAQAKAEVDAKEPMYDSLLDELQKSQQPDPQKIGQFQQLGAELGVLSTLANGITPRQAIAELPALRAQIEANQDTIARLDPNDATAQAKLTENEQLQARAENFEAVIIYAASKGALTL